MPRKLKSNVGDKVIEITTLGTHVDTTPTIENCLVTTPDRTHPLISIDDTIEDYVVLITTSKEKNSFSVISPDVRFFCIVLRPKKLCVEILWRAV